MTQHPLYKHLMGLPVREPYTPEDREEYGPGSFYNIHFTCQDCDPCYGHQLYTWSTVYLDEDELYHRWGAKEDRRLDLQPAAARTREIGTSKCRNFLKPKQTDTRSCLFCQSSLPFLVIRPSFTSVRGGLC